MSVESNSRGSRRKAGPTLRRKDKDPVTRAIEAKERALASAEKHIAAIQSEADERKAAIRKKMAQTQVLLDALRRATLKP